MRYAGGGQVAFDGGQYFASQMSAEFIVGVAQKPGAQVFIGIAADHVVAQQALDGLRNERRGAAIADRARDGCVLTDRSAEAEVIGVGELAFMLDFLSFHADVGDPVLTASVGATCDVKAKLLIELRQALFKLVDQPAGKALGFGDGELAEFGARAGNRAAPEGRTLDLQTKLAEFARRVPMLCCWEC